MKYASFLILLLTCLKASAQVTSFTFDPNSIDKKLATTMDSLFREDQQYRMEAGRLRQAGAPKQTMDSIAAVIKKKDSSNLVLAEKLIAAHGWITPQMAGMQGSQALFLVIQHAGLNVQKKYYPLIKNAEKEGQILSSNVAILEDRIAVREGKPQTYGSQGVYDQHKKTTITYPLKDLENLDSLRKSMGLQPMNEYLKEWDPQVYLSNLPYARQLLEKAAGSKI